MTRLLVVDGQSIAKTVAYPMMKLTNGTSYNFFKQIASTLKKLGDVDDIFVAWEGGHEFRKALYPEYKGGRVKSLPSFYEQRNIIQKLLPMLGVTQMTSPGHEGDDVAANLVHNYAKSVGMVLYTNDNDWLQLIRPGVSVFKKVPGEGPKSERREINAANFQQLLGFPTPGTFLTSKCLEGDGTDEIPGVQGVGAEYCRAYVLGQQIPEAKKQHIENFLKSPEFDRNMKLMDLISRREIPLVLTEPKTNRGSAKDLMTELGWRSITAKADDFDKFWSLFPGAKD